jgi:hypothetical protein
MSELKRKTPMPPRRTLLEAKAPLARTAELGRGSALEGSAPIDRRTQIKRVSTKRRAENRQRRKMADTLFPERPVCRWPDCGEWADDLHEPLTRARGGSIIDPENAVPLCRPHHDALTFTPESELGWAHEAGLLRHSWDGIGGAA